MNYKNFFFLSLGLWIVVILSLGKFFFMGQTHSASDGRKYVELNPDEKNYVLTEMRGLLTAVNEILVGMAANDNQKISLAAKSVGMGGHNTVEANHNAIMLKLPVDFKKMGMDLHGEFDSLSELAETPGVSSSELLLKLSGITGRCVHCHTGYRFCND